jgi:TIR domain/Effector-associated domain 11
MIIDIDKLREFVAANKTDRALQALKDDIKAYPALQNQLFGLSARFADIRSKKISGLLDDEEEMRFNATVNSNVLELLNEIEMQNEAAADFNKPLLQGEPEKNTIKTKSVFISYNHHDIEIANKLKDKLTAAGINVVIDSEKMEAGEDIKEFIEKCVRETSATISLISTNSLLSAWVAMESVNTFYHEKTDTSKKFIACFITDDFFKRDFTDNALDHVDAEIKEIQELVTARMQKNRSIRDLQNELTRNTELRNNMDEIVRRLRESLCVDIRDEKFESNFTKITDAVNS